jgi:hypothetical protein
VQAEFFGEELQPGENKSRGAPAGVSRPCLPRRGADALQFPQCGRTVMALDYLLQQAVNLLQEAAAAVA